MQTVNDSCEKATRQSVSVASALSEMKEKADSRVETYKNLDTAFDDINKEFCKKTSILNKKDQTFLWTAVALQLIRWMFLTSFIEERPNDQEAAKEVKGNKIQYSKFYSSFFEIISMNFSIPTVATLLIWVMRPSRTGTSFGSIIYIGVEAFAYA